MSVNEKKKVQIPKIQWKDYFNALVELDNLPFLEKITQSFDIVVLAADSFKNRTVTEGVVIGMTVEVEGFRDKVCPLSLPLSRFRFWRRHEYC
jgi:hypothetical protein